MLNPWEQRAEPRRSPTFTVAGVPAVGTVGVVEAIVEGQAPDAGQWEQQDQEQQDHGGSPSVSWARLWPRQIRQKRKKKPIKGAPCVSTPTHSLNRSLKSIFCRPGTRISKENFISPFNPQANRGTETSSSCAEATQPGGGRGRTLLSIL